MKNLLRSMILCCLITLSSMNLSAAEPKCLWVSSYAPGYAWSDGIGDGLHSVLDGKCEVKVFYMDTKNNKAPEFAKSQALKAKQLIESYKPDVMIASDDNASKYLVVPYYKNVDLPIVVCGINWTTKEHAYPFSNVTGMIEVLQIKPLMSMVKKILSINSGSIFVLGPNTHSARLNAKYMEKYFNNTGFTMNTTFVDTFEQWKEAYLKGQQDDVIFLINVAGSTGWDMKNAIEFVSKNSTKLTIGNQKWYSPVTMIIYAKRPEEQGEWAANVALKILDGTLPSDIPMVTNRDWEQYINTRLLDSAGIKISSQLLKNSITD